MSNVLFRCMFLAVMEHLRPGFGPGYVFRREYQRNLSCTLPYIWLLKMELSASSCQSINFFFKGSGYFWQVTEYPDTNSWNWRLAYLKRRRHIFSVPFGLNWIILEREKPLYFVKGLECGLRLHYPCCPRSIYLAEMVSYYYLSGSKMPWRWKRKGLSFS